MIDDAFTDPRDGNRYRTVRIGSQHWLAENLRYLPSVCPPTQAPDGSPLHYVYDYHGHSVTEARQAGHYRHFGVLYNWPAALAAVPPGWHLPSDAEWSQLTDLLIDTHRHLTALNVGAALKSCRRVHAPSVDDSSTSAYPRWTDPAPRPPAAGVVAAVRRVLADVVVGVRVDPATDEFGFSALPGGRCQAGAFYRLGDLGYWWSSTEASPLRAWCRQMTLGGAVNRWDLPKDDGFSVRCIRD